GVAVVELQRVLPGGEVGVAAVGDDGRAALRQDQAEVRRLALQVLLVALDVELGPLLGPAVVEGGGVGHEVEQQAQAAPPEPSARYYMAAARGSNQGLRVGPARKELPACSEEQRGN